MVIAEVEAAQADPEVGWQTRVRISALRPSAARFRVPRRAKRRAAPANLARVSLQPFLPTPSAPSVSLQPLRAGAGPSSSAQDGGLQLADLHLRRTPAPDGRQRCCCGRQPHTPSPRFPRGFHLLFCGQNDFKLLHFSYMQPAL